MTNNVKHKSNRAYETGNDLPYLLLFTCLFVGISFLIIAYGPEWVINHRLSHYKEKIINGSIGQYGDLFGGTLGPLVGLFGTGLAFLAFGLQFRANKLQTLQFKIQNEDSIFFKSFDDLQSKVEHAKIKVKINDDSDTINELPSSKTETNHVVHQDGRTIDGYNCLNFLAEDFREQLIKGMSQFARNLLCRTPEVANAVFFSKIYGPSLSMKLNDKNQLVDEFVEQMNSRDKNERWEYLKIHVGSLGTESYEQMEGLIALGSVQFYRVPFHERFYVYNQTYEYFSAHYGGFLDAYFRNLEFILELAHQSKNQTLYLEYIHSRMSADDLLLFFYFLISGHGKDTTYGYVKEYELFRDLYKYNYRLIDLPDPKQVKDELEELYKIPVFAPFSNFGNRSYLELE